MKVKDYIFEIKRRKQEAFKNNETHLIIRAGDLHSEYGTKGSPSLIQCCSAMKQCMLSGDKIISNKENKSGASAALTINYSVIDMGNRKSINCLKKRGRPVGSKNVKERVSNNRKIINVNLCVENWMNKNRIRYKSYNDIFLIDDTYGLWVIAKYREENPRERFITALKVIKDEHYKCSVLFRDSLESREFWNNMSETTIERLNLTALFISTDGSVIQIS